MQRSLLSCKNTFFVLFLCFRVLLAFLFFFFFFLIWLICNHACVIISQMSQCLPMESSLSYAEHHIYCIRHIINPLAFSSLKTAINQTGNMYFLSRVEKVNMISELKQSNFKHVSVIFPKSIVSLAL